MHPIPDLRRPLLLALGLGCALPAGGADFRKTLDQALARPALAGSVQAGEVRSLRTGRVLWSRNPTLGVEPASTLKLLATAAALDAFGPGWRAETTVQTAGRLDGTGRVLGDVFLVGAGDPALGTADLASLAEQVVAGGVRRIEGRLVGDESLFSGDRRGSTWAWDDLVWGYGAEVSALSLDDNQVTLRVSPGEREGDPVRVDVAPACACHRLVKTATTAAASTTAALVLEREPGENVVRLGGTLPLGADPEELEVALADPARCTVTAFRDQLAARGVLVTGDLATATAPRAAGLRVLARHQGPPLSDLVAGVNKPSQNLHAEMLVRLLGAREGGPGTAEAGIVAEQAVARRLGVDLAAWYLDDGSGLSRANLATAHGMVDLLAAKARHPHAAVYRASLPVAGVDGTLRKRMKGTRAEGRLAAKTGSFRHVNALAGYVDSADGEPLAFAFLLDNHTASGPEALAALDAAASGLAAARVRR